MVLRSNYARRSARPATTAGVGIDDLDPSIRLGWIMLRQNDPDAATALIARYGVNAKGERLMEAYIPSFVGGLASRLGAAVRRVGPERRDWALTRIEFT